MAQQFLVVPGVQAPVPAPPPPAAVIQPVPNAPPKVDTFGDRVTRCMHHGGVQGLPAGPRDAYVRACANN